MTPNLKHAYPAGFENVFLESGYERIDGPFGPAFRYAKSQELDQSVCAAVLQKPGRLNAGEVLYLRLRADWTQEDLAGRLHLKTDQSVSLWERGLHRIPAHADMLLRKRFLDEAPKNKRPKFRLLWSKLDQFVKTIQDFYYVGRFDKTWGFAYQAIPTEFVAPAEHAIVDLTAADMDELVKAISQLRPAAHAMFKAVRYVPRQHATSYLLRGSVEEVRVTYHGSTPVMVPYQDTDHIPRLIEPRHSAPIFSRDFGETKIKVP
jgi:transcriptional regulator with XRE-family HTH domain